MHGFAIGQTARVARAIMEVLSPMTGTRARGYALVHALAGDVLLRKGSFAAPVLTSATGNQDIDRENLVRTTVDVIVNAAGVLVPLVSMLGGARQNLPATTALRWSPRLDGVEAVSAVGPAPLTGGADPADGTPGAVKQIVTFEGVAAGTAGVDLIKARAEMGAPCLVVAWNSEALKEKAGRDRYVGNNSWSVFIAVSRGEGAVERGLEGLDLIDAVAGHLDDRASVGGFILSAPPASVTAKRRIATTDTVLVYAVDIVTRNAVRRIVTDDTEECVPSDWESVQFDLRTGQADPPFPLAAPVYPMILPGFDEGFDEGFGH